MQSFILERSKWTFQLATKYKPKLRVQYMVIYLSLGKKSCLSRFLMVISG